MKKFLQIISSVYNNESFQKTWKDPVWSKVISAAIIAILSIIISTIYLGIKKLNLLFINDFINNNISNEFLRLFLKILTILSILYLIIFTFFKKNINEWFSKNTTNDSENGDIPLLNEHPNTLFDYKLGRSFPSTRKGDIVWFDKPKEAAHRLDVLLKGPLRYKVVRNGFVGNYDIFVWYRDTSSMYVSSFQIMNGSNCLMDNYYELNINKIAVYRSFNSRYNFVYVETKPTKMTGFYNKKDYDHWMSEYGYYQEPYAVLRKRQISIQDYDDGATIINRKVVSVDGAKARVRYVSKYNFIITSQTSPYNSTFFETNSGHYFKLALTNNDYDSLWNFLESCRKSDDYDRMTDPYYRDFE